jgi:citrate synthase
MSQAPEGGDNPCFMDQWRTAIVRSEESALWIHGHEVTDLMRRATFADAIFLLHRGRLPDERERTLIDAILIGVCDPGPAAPSCAAARLVASGNRQSMSAAVAAGVLAVGDEHGGAGEQCMAMIADGIADAKQRSISFDTAATELVDGLIARGGRVPGLGHRVHRTVDRRVDVLFSLARQGDEDAPGVRFMQAVAAAASRRIKPLPINIDGGLAAVLYDMGFPPEAGKLIFIIGRVAGLTAEVAEEYAREKPMRVKIPVQYDGQAPR